MIALYLLAAHLVGDFVLQSRTMSARKLDEPLWRLAHVAMYLLPMACVAAWALWGDSLDDGLGRGYAFLVLVGGAHYLTDSRRFQSTLMDWIEWRRSSQDERRDAWLASSADTAGKTMDSLPPNPWAPLPIVLDQTLHVCQVAVIAGVFLAR